MTCEAVFKLSTRLCDKRDDFDFHIVNLQFRSSNGVYISHLIRYGPYSAQIMMILDVVTGAWLVDFRLKATKFYGLISHSRNFMADIKISLRNNKGQ